MDKLLYQLIEQYLRLLNSNAPMDDVYAEKEKIVASANTLAEFLKANTDRDHVVAVLLNQLGYGVREGD